MSQELFEAIGNQLNIESGVVLGQMFGKPCLKTAENKAFAAFYKGEMVFKLGKVDVDLKKQIFINSVNWDPSGKNRPMKDWLQVPVDYKDEWSVLAKAALDFVAGQ